jgi:hypothetical protein
MKITKWMLVLFICTVGISCLMTSVSLVLAETFDLHIRSYCPSGSNCNHANWTAYQDFICEVVEEMNLEYKKKGFSFRPTIFANDPSAPTGGVPGAPADKNQYSEINIANACKNENADDDRLQEHWHENVAAANPAAISMMLDARSGTCCSSSGSYAIFCDAAASRGVLNTGTGWAHEMGHYWGLSHTFTRQDQETHPNPDWDGDDVTGAGGILPAIEDTPDDPEAFENCPWHCGGDKNKDRCSSIFDCAYLDDPPELCLRACTSEHDEDANGNLRDGHVWINFGSIPGGADTGSPHPDYCEAVWITRSGGQTIATNPAPTYTENAMSYYGQSCRAPFVLGGHPFEPFTPDQLTRMHSSRTMISERITLVDVCAPWGDFDNDGMCDNVDSCPTIGNLCDQTDTDGDTVGDLCDNCRDEPNPGQDDSDGDCSFIATPYTLDPECGDACDKDRDGDGCENDDDQHPDQREVEVGGIPAGNCGQEAVTIYQDEKEDIDNDLISNCSDCDDDGDGLCDPWVAGDPECASQCDGSDPCPIDETNLCNLIPPPFIDCPPPWLECIGGNCVEFFLKFTYVINPDPTKDIVFDRFQILNETLYVVPAVHAGTTSEHARNIGNLAQSIGGFSNMAESADVILPPRERIRLEIWKRAPSPAAADMLVAVVGEWPAGAIQMGDITRGGIIRLTPIEASDTSPGELRVATTWALGIEEGMELPDADGDSWPDMADNCVNTENDNQFDADKDGFGNTCDFDLDNDGEVTQADIARARACEGADLSIEIPILEPEELGGDPDAVMPDVVAATLAAACRSADVTGDWMVDSTDTALVETHLGDKLDLDPGVQPLPPLQVSCIDPVPFQKVKLDILHLNKPAGSQELFFKGKMALPYPFTPVFDPVDNGIRFVIWTAQGHTLLDTLVMPGSDSWKINADDTHVEFHKKTGNNQMKISLEWGNSDKPGTVMVIVMAKDFDFLVDAAELPLHTELSLNASTVATQQCARSDFQLSPEIPGCSLRSKGKTLRCR